MNIKYSETLQTHIFKRKTFFLDKKIFQVAE